MGFNLPNASVPVLVSAMLICDSVHEGDKGDGMVWLAQEMVHKVKVGVRVHEAKESAPDYETRGEWSAELQVITTKRSEADRSVRGTRPRVPDMNG